MMPILKRKPLRDRAYLDFVRTQKCVITDRAGDDVDPAHLRTGLVVGLSIKPDDCFVLPLSNALHQRQHRIGEVRFWREHIPAWLLMAAASRRNDNPPTRRRCAGTAEALESTGAMDD